MTYYLTREGYKEHSNRVKELQKKIDDINDKIRELECDDDLVSEYDNKRKSYESEKKEKGEIIKDGNYLIIEDQDFYKNFNSRDPSVIMGSFVFVKEKGMDTIYKIVGYKEKVAEYDDYETLPYNSPLAKVILGQKAGNTVFFENDHGKSIEIQIKSVSLSINDKKENVKKTGGR